MERKNEEGVSKRRVKRKACERNRKGEGEEERAGEEGRRGREGEKEKGKHNIG